MRTNIQIIKENIKQELKQRGSNIQTLCKDLKTDRLFIYRMTDEVKLNKIVRIANAIGCPTSELLKGI